MKTFRDNHGRCWTIDLEPVSVARIRAETGVDLDNLDGLAVLFGRPETLVHALWVLCESHAEEYDVAPEEFGRLMAAGDNLPRAVEALAEELVAASPDPRARDVVARELAAARKILDRDRRHARHRRAHR
jgi:hypothetical protein